MGSRVSHQAIAHRASCEGKLVEENEVNAIHFLQSPECFRGGLMCKVAILSETVPLCGLSTVTLSQG